ncbi:hypothetical protein DVH24_003770 [Malus domestica]|uniref:Uncharacterized protein n=1 Tax=Malus domestica TaxID=3750 RepID=A0A498K6U6_MALDO|nr:hypothetical protein DVH24_003770 [Malus domestica]
MVKTTSSTFTMEGDVTKVQTNLIFTINTNHMKCKAVWREAKSLGSPITILRVCVRIPHLPIQYRDKGNIKSITQAIGKAFKVDEATLNELNGLFIKVLMEIDVQLPLKRVLVVNGENGNPILISYKKLFEVYFYYGRSVGRSIRGFHALFSLTYECL